MRRDPSRARTPDEPGGDRRGDHDGDVGSLPSERLRWQSDLTRLGFETTDQLDLERADGSAGSPDLLGQPRAVQALDFGLGIEDEGFNLFALGPAGCGKRELVTELLERKAATRPVADDWCYVHNFDDASRPRALRLPAGTARRLQGDMEKLVEDLRNALASAMESEEYHARRHEIEQELQEHHEQIFEELREKSEKRGLTPIRTPTGVALAPVEDGEPLSAEEMQKLPKERREEIEKAAGELHGELQRRLRQMPRIQRALRDKLDELSREFAHLASVGLIEELQERYRELPQVVAYLAEIQRDVVADARRLVARAPEEDRRSERGGRGDAPGIDDGRGSRLGPARRYRVNVLVEHRDEVAAPVVYEGNPTLSNLIGEVEHLAHLGALTTDFNLIKAGALHRANGGYLLLDARQVLSSPFVWESLKRALQDSCVRIESPAEQLTLIRTVTLEPEPIPLDVKVALLGEPLLYYLLSAHDPEFQQLFKVQVDFAERMERTPETEALYARMVAGLIERHDLRPFHREAVAAVLERSARLAGDAQRLSTEGRAILDLLRQASYWAGREESEVVGARHVRRAIEEQIFRADRVRERTYESIERGDLLIDTTGVHLAQVNGLSVTTLGTFTFARPVRITARVRLGEGEVVDIERETRLGGPLHSKGVLILAGFLGARAGRDLPLSIRASLVFEQSYGGVDGDSASSAELYALISAITEIPLRQSIAVTGAVNQHGDVQAIGGVNEKIEGFFDVCRARGLDGEQGVMIPAANVKHLMLREDVVEAVRAGRFHVHAVRNVDQGLELLTGLPAGEPDDHGEYPEGTVNARLRAALTEMARRRLALLRDSLRATTGLPV